VTISSVVISASEHNLVLRLDSLARFIGRRRRLSAPFRRALNERDGGSFPAAIAG
jgi:hypothetical protein